jgi:hypothetical protein
MNTTLIFSIVALLLGVLNLVLGGVSRNQHQLTTANVWFAASIILSQTVL